VRSKAFPIKKAAEAYQAKMKTALHEGHYIAPDFGKIRLAEWWERYRQTPAWAKLTAATKALYEIHWRNHIDRAWGIGPSRA
jgi:hypothetical protein